MKEEDTTRNVEDGEIEKEENIQNEKDEGENIAAFSPEVLTELMKEGRIQIDSSDDIDTSNISPEQLQELLSAQAASIKVTRKSQFNGPIPPPEIIAEYQAIQNDFPERIMAMAERQQGHRHKMENKALNADILMGVLGWLTPTLIVLLALFFAYVLLSAGKDTEAFVAVIVAIGTLLGAYYNKKKKTDSQEDSSES